MTQALQPHLTRHTEDLIKAAVHLQLEAVRRAAAQMAHRKRLMLTHPERLTDPTAREHILRLNITMPYMTQRSTNLLNSPHTPPISVHATSAPRKNAHHQTPPPQPPVTPGDHPPLSEETTRHCPPKPSPPRTMHKST